MQEWGGAGEGTSRSGEDDRKWNRGAEEDESIPCFVFFILRGLGASLVAQMESAWNAGDLGSIPELGKMPWRREWLPTPVFWPGKFHGQKRLAGYSLWGCKESDMTERLSLLRGFVLVGGKGLFRATSHG